MPLEVFLNVHAYPSFVLSRYFLQLSIYLVLKLTLVISLYGILVSSCHFPSASNSLIVSLFFPAFKIIPIWNISSFSFSTIAHSPHSRSELNMLCHELISILGALICSATPFSLFISSQTSFLIFAFFSSSILRIVYPLSSKSFSSCPSTNLSLKSLI